MLGVFGSGRRKEEKEYRKEEKEYRKEEKEGIQGTRDTREYKGERKEYKGPGILPSLSIPSLVPRPSYLLALSAHYLLSVCFLSGPLRFATENKQANSGPKGLEERNSRTHASPTHRPLVPLGHVCWFAKRGPGWLFIIH